MSREVIIKIRDDLDRSDADETIAFSYRGTSYEIDLSAANVEVFDKSMDQFVKVARKVVPSAPPRVAGSRPPLNRKPIVSRATVAQRREIRDWAEANGFPMRAQGMIARVVVEAFQAANPQVTLLPNTVGNYTRRGSAVAGLTVQEVRAARDEDGLIAASALMSQPRDRAARDRYGEKLGKAKRTEIRAWANAHGFEQAATGQVQRAVLEAYYAAHPEG